LIIETLLGPRSATTNRTGNAWQSNLGAETRGGSWQSAPETDATPQKKTEAHGNRTRNVTRGTSNARAALQRSRRVRIPARPDWSVLVRSDLLEGGKNLARLKTRVSCPAPSDPSSNDPHP
jgi:hypothetical protein